MIYETNSAQETFELGRRIGQQAKKGQIYTLEGDLGVGKTVLTQGVAAGLKITEPISSPTFTILQEYQEGRLRVGEFNSGNPARECNFYCYRKKFGKRI